MKFMSAVPAADSGVQYVCSIRREKLPVGYFGFVRDLRTV